MFGTGNRAKVTDFGMAKLFNLDHVDTTRQTKCPGTPACMSPEALDDPPVYTTKLDSFSFGILGIQIITRLFSDPGPCTREIRNRCNTRHRLQEVVPETKRRKSHIDLH